MRLHIRLDFWPLDRPIQCISALHSASFPFTVYYRVSLCTCGCCPDLADGGARLRWGPWFRGPQWSKWAGQVGWASGAASYWSSTASPQNISLRPIPNTRERQTLAILVLPIPPKSSTRGWRRWRRKEAKAAVCGDGTRPGRTRGWRRWQREEAKAAVRGDGTMPGRTRGRHPTVRGDGARGPGVPSSSNHRGVAVPAPGSLHEPVQGGDERAVAATGRGRLPSGGERATATRPRDQDSNSPLPLRREKEMNGPWDPFSCSSPEMAPSTHPAFASSTTPYPTQQGR
jgi:hypothetical protein